LNSRSRYSEPVLRQALSIRYELKRACGLEGEAESVERFGRNIRNPQVHVPPSLTATCQLQELSLKAERNTYIWPMVLKKSVPDEGVFLFAF